MPFHPRWVARAAFALALVLAPRLGYAQDPSADDDAARREFRLAEAHYTNGQFAEAAQGFTRAYRLSLRPALLYNMYIAYRDADDLPHARDALAVFLEQNPDDPRSDQLRARLDQLVGRFGPPRPIEEIDTQAPVVAPAGGQAPTEAAGESADPAAVETDPAADASDVDSADPAAQSTDTGGNGGVSIPALVLMGGGAALLVGSAVTGAIALGAESELEDKCDGTRCRSSLESTIDKGETMALASDILLATGVAAAAAGVILFFLDSGDSEQGAPLTAAVGCGSRGCAGAVTVSF